MASMLVGIYPKELKMNVLTEEGRKTARKGGRGKITGGEKEELACGKQEKKVVFFIYRYKT